MEIKASLPQCIIDGSLTIVHASIAVIYCMYKFYDTIVINDVYILNKSLHFMCAYLVFDYMWNVINYERQVISKTFFANSCFTL